MKLESMKPVVVNHVKKYLSLALKKGMIFSYSVKQELPASYGKIRLWRQDQLAHELTRFRRDFDFVEWPIEKSATYRLEISGSGLIVSNVLYYDPATVLETGVTHIDVMAQELQVYSPDNLHAHYIKDPYRPLFHFSAFKNWLNDPNGLIYHQGMYHLFYQYYPHAPIWGNMHWGHAVSDDLLTWKHLPVTLYPQEELFDNPDYLGGAFSGSAIEAGDTIRLFYTCHYEKRDRSVWRETQESAFCRDGLHIEQGPTLLAHPPAANIGRDFRDPKVFQTEDGDWGMVLGSKIDDIPCVLFYRSANLDDWIYEGVLYKETEVRAGTIECPDFFRLGDKYVLIFGLIGSVDAATGRKNLSYYAVGDFDGARFTVEHKAELDFGTDFYALQTFEAHGKRLGFAWLDNWATWMHTRSKDFMGVMSLPRELTLDAHTLCLHPIESLTNLRTQQIISLQTLSETVFECPFASPLLELSLALHDQTAFLITFYSQAQPDEYVAVKCEDDRLEILVSNEPYATRYSTRTEKIIDLRMFLDNSVIEVCANQASRCGTKRFYCEHPFGVAHLEFQKPQAVEQLVLWNLKSIW